MITFEIGEIAILQYMPAPYEHLNGEECTVVSLTRKGQKVRINGVPATITSDGYAVHTVGGLKCGVIDRNLRKKPDPKQAERIANGLIKRLTDSAKEVV